MEGVKGAARLALSLGGKRRSQTAKTRKPGGSGMLSERQKAGEVGLFSSVQGIRPRCRLVVASSVLHPLDAAALLLVLVD